MAFGLTDIAFLAYAVGAIKGRQTALSQRG
jgi:hypothetical protein